MLLFLNFIVCIDGFWYDEKKIKRCLLNSDETSTLYHFDFTGKATVFFKIWIVNMLLSIITFGIYSPWAKVRNNRYIYGSICLNGLAFEYTANPLKILFGRLIVVGIYIIYFILSDFFGLYNFALGILVVFILSIPFLIRQSICFKARYTRYQGVSFYHFASIWQYYKYCITHLFLIIFTFGLIFPYSMKKFKDLVINHTSYGDKNFTFTTTASKFYEAYLKVLALSFIPMMILGVILSLTAKVLVDNFADLNSTTNSQSIETMSAFIGILGVLNLVILLFTPFLKGVFSGWIGNIIYNSTTIDTFRLKSDWKPWKLGWISLSNAVLIILSLGLMYPWAKLRVLRHKTEHTYIQGEGFEDFTNIKHKETKAFGEEAADFFDVDIGL